MKTQMVAILVTGGAYAGCSYTGELANAPVTILVPEGIVSARTSEEAERVRASLGDVLETHDAVTMVAVNWALRAERVEVQS